METSDPTTFGELVHHFRKRAHLTQQTLAARVGINFYTISKWERGVYLPESRTMVLEVARQLRLTEPETRQLLEASLTALSPSWLVPAPRNPFFTGRIAMLERLHQRLQQEQAVAVSQSYALSGLGGIGKTQLALEYAYQHAQDYHAVFWVAAETAETLAASFIQIAELLHLPERAAKDQPQVVQAVLRWLTTHKGWLLIYDNMEDVQALKPFLPAARQGAILLTTRLQTLEGVAPRLDLAAFSLAEGVQFLLARAGLREGNAPLEEMPRAILEAAHALAEALGGLPLALDQAGAYIERNGCALADYLRLYQQREVALLSERSPAAEHPQSVVTTVALAFEQVAARSPAAAELLEACAYLAPEAIPEDLLKEGAAQWGGALGTVAGDEEPFNRALGEVLCASLLQRDAEQHTLSVHRLVQAVLRGQLNEERQQTWAERVVRLLAAAFPDPNEYATWGQCQRLLPHVLASVGHLERWGFTFPEGARLLDQTGEYLRQRGQYADVLPLAKQALTIREQVLGPDHPDVAESLHVLASLYWNQGQFALALPLWQRAQMVFAQALSSNQPAVAERVITLSRNLVPLSRLYKSLTTHNEAVPLSQLGLALSEQMLGSDHPLVAWHLINLAMLHHSQGNTALGLPLAQRAQEIFEQALLPDHPDMTRSLITLAHLHTSLAAFDEALPLAQRALALAEQVLLREHPDLAWILNTLATLYHAQGQDEQALLLVKRALTIQEQALYPNHPDIALSLNMLAIIYQALSQYEQALPVALRALRIQEQALEPEHPEVATSLATLASLFRAQGQAAQAELRFQRALAIREQHKLQQHPDTAATLAEFAVLRETQGQILEAASLYQRALMIQEQVYGLAHPKTTDTRQRLWALRADAWQGEAATDPEGAPQEPPEAMRPPAAQPRRTDQVRVQPSALGPQVTPRTIHPRLVHFTCGWCGQTVSQQRYPGPRPRYCSDTCQQQATRQQTRARVERLRAKQERTGRCRGEEAPPEQ